MNKWIEIDNKVSQAKEYVKQLEDMRDIIKALPALGCGFDEAKEERVKALDFAVEFIKQGIGGKML